MKKIIALLLALIMLMGICAVASAEEWKFERGITIVCPWGLGGGADGTIRPMATLLQNKLGVAVDVRNETGGSGVTGATSINMLAGSKVQMEKYGIHNFSELKEYAAAHPYEVSVAMLTATGVDGMCFEIATDGLALNAVTYDSGSAANSDMAGGHVDLSVGGYDDMSGLIESGDIIPLLLFCEHRVDIMPDCECTGELGIDSYAGPWRAIFAKKGTPQGAIDALVAAIEECRNDPSWQEFLKNAAYDQRVVPEVGEATQTFCWNEYKDLRDYMFEQETLEKDYDDLK